MFKEQFSRHLAQFNTSPFLFIGSGFSRRYLGLEDWEGLLKHMVGRLNIEMPYEYFSSNANGDLPKVASLIGQNFNEKWWTTQDFAQSREEYAKYAKSTYSPFKFEVSKYIIESSSDNRSNIEKRLICLRKL